MFAELLGLQNVEPQRAVDTVELTSSAVKNERDIYQDLKTESPVMLFHYLRFDAFKDVKPEELGPLLKSLGSTSCGNPAFLKPFVELAKKKDLQGCESLASTHSSEGQALVDKLKSEGYDIVQVKDMNEIVDLYLKEQSPAYALAMLEALLFFEITDDGSAYKSYIQYIASGIPEDMKKNVFHGKTYHGFEI